MKRKLFSIGYNGFSVQGFVAALTESGVECVVDTRELPISRKKGFAKSALQNHLHEAGIVYRHFRVLGSPRFDRREVRNTGDYATFFSRVRKHLATLEAMTALQNVIEIARIKTSCLMCCCPDWRFCHRSCVADAITKRTYFAVEHLERTVERVIQRKVA